MEQLPAGTRRRSIDSPLQFSGLTTKLARVSTSLMTAFDRKKGRMEEVAEEMRKISDGVRRMQGWTSTVRMGGVLALGLGLALIIFIDEFTGGPSDSGIAIAGMAMFLGFVAVIVVNVYRTIRENSTSKRVENLGTELLRTLEPMKEDLQVINVLSELSEIRAAAAQAANTLTQLREFHRVLDKVSKVRERSADILAAVFLILTDINNLLELIKKICTFIPSTDHDQALRDAVVQSAAQSQRVMVSFRRMREELEGLTRV